MSYVAAAQTTYTFLSGGPSNCMWIDFNVLHKQEVAPCKLQHLCSLSPLSCPHFQQQSFILSSQNRLYAICSWLNSRKTAVCDQLAEQSQAFSCKRGGGDQKLSSKFSFIVNFLMLWWIYDFSQDPWNVIHTMLILLQIHRITFRSQRGSEGMVVEKAANPVTAVPDSISTL